MTLSDTGVGLTENRQVVLVVRLTLDQDSQVLYGELLNADGTGQGRFKSLSSLGSTVKRWLERQPDHPLPLRAASNEQPTTRTALDSADGIQIT